MKKILLFAATIALVGAGCLGGGNKPVEGDWVLTFDLPKDWVMVGPYNLDSPIDLEGEIERTDAEVWLQSTDTFVYPSSGAGLSDDQLAEYGIDEILYTDFSLVKVTHLDSRRLIPEEAEDLGDGFYRVKLCEDGEECQIGGAHNYDYYYETENGKYKFDITGYTDKVEDVIFSAQETDAEDVDYGFVE